MRKIIFITENRLTNNDNVKFGFNYYNKKVKLEKINISPLTKPEYFNHIKKFKGKKDAEYILNFSLLEKKLIQNKNSIFICNFANLSSSSSKVLKILNDNEIKYILVNSGQLSKYNIKKLEYFYFGFRYPIFTLKKIIHYFYKKTFSKFIPNKIFSSNFEEIKNNKKLIYIPSYDYDYYSNKKKNLKKKHNTKYCVFLDTPQSHLDGIFAKLRYPPETPCNVKDYYNPLNKFMKHHEKNIKIKILPHPRSNEKDINHLQFGKKSNKEKLQLIYNSQYVLTFGYAAISFAILLNKPIIFLTHDKLTFHNKKNIETLSSELNSTLLNIGKYDEKNFENLKINKIDKNKYKKFKKKYIGKNFHLKSYEIIYKELFVKK